MAGPNYGLDKGFIPDVAIGSSATGPDLATSYDYFLFVKPVAASPDHVVLSAAANDVTIGVSQQRVAAADVTLGIVADIRLEGISKVVAGAAVAIGAPVTSNASGRAVTATTGQRQAGIALSTAAANGDIIDVALTPGGQVP
jgi:hypothetical protein